CGTEVLADRRVLPERMSDTEFSHRHAACSVVCRRIPTWIGDPLSLLRTHLLLLGLAGASVALGACGSDPDIADPRAAAGTAPGGSVSSSGGPGGGQASSVTASSSDSTASSGGAGASSDSSTKSASSASSASAGGAGGSDCPKGVTAPCYDGPSGT